MNCVICNSSLQGNQKKYCSNACKQKNTYLNRNGYDVQMKRGYERKLYFIEYLGGGCKKCGYNKNIAALEFHHREEKLKSFSLDLRSFSNNKLTKIQEEVDKCDLLCANCHREHHNPETTFDKIKIFLNS